MSFTEFFNPLNGVAKIEFLYYLVLILSIVYTIIPNHLAKQYVEYVIVCSPYIMIPIFVIRFKNNIIYLIRKPKHETLVFPPKAYEMIGNEKISLTDPPFIMVNDKNVLAFANQKIRKIMFGRDFYNLLTDDERIFVIGHELSHFKKTEEKVVVKSIFVIICVVFALSFLHLQPSLAWSPVVAIFCISLNNSARYLERMADMSGASYVSKETAIKAIRQSYQDRPERTSQTHPAMNYRIKNLERYYSQFN